MKMTRYISTKVQDLKKGDQVGFHGEIFTVIEDAAITEHPADEDVYWAPCLINNMEERRGKISNLLLTYDGFQGSFHATQTVIKDV